VIANTNSSVDHERRRRRRRRRRGGVSQGGGGGGGRRPSSLAHLKDQRLGVMSWARRAERQHASGSKGLYIYIILSREFLGCLIV
jgi:hypothetical protein